MHTVMTRNGKGDRMSRDGIIVHLVDDRMFFKVLGSEEIASLSEAMLT